MNGTKIVSENRFQPEIGLDWMKFVNRSYFFFYQIFTRNSYFKDVTN